MRWIVALTLGCGSTVLALACGGTPFSVDQSLTDATADMGADVASGDVSDAPYDASLVELKPKDDASRDGSNADDASEAGADDAAAKDDAGDALDDRDSEARTPFDAPDESAVDAALHCGDGFACVPALPTGWAGPFELATAILAPVCDTNFSGATLLGHAGLIAGPATCDCSCDATQGPACPPQTIDFYATSIDCSEAGATPCARTTLTPGACTEFDALQTCDAGVAGVVMTVPVSAASPESSPASCTALPKTLVPTAAWLVTSHACGASVSPGPADCQAGSMCAPTPGVPFLATVCIEQAGDVPCPSPDTSIGYVVKRLYYGDFDDQRGCSDCSCTADGSASCAVTINQFPSIDGGCAGMPISYAAGACLPVQQPADLQLALTPSLASCTPSPTTATGAASPTKPMTFCCTQ